VQQPPTPLEPIEIHYYYACSWIINQHGINQFRDIADTAVELGIDLRVRRMFTDQHGYVMYPFTVKVPDEAALRTFLAQVAAGVGMEEWYIVNVAYYEQGVSFADNLTTVLTQMPRWEEQMRKYAEHNAGVYAALQQQTPDDTQVD
jgi:hypothetical protein